jgi:hypothetical protein
MFRRTLKAGLALLLAAAPLSATAFIQVDLLPRASGGHFPAYPADPTPLRTLWVQYGAMYDSNLLRRNAGDNEDFVQRLGGGIALTQRVIGRQTAHLEGRLDAYLYNNFSTLDNIGYSALGEWRWEIGNDLAGVLGISRRRYQAAPAETQRAAEDPITVTRYTATGGWRLGPTVRLRGGTEYVDYQRPQAGNIQLKTLIGYVGADYVTNLGNTLGVEFRQTNGDAPVNVLIDPTGQFGGNHFTQRDVMVNTGWVFSPQWRLTGRVGRTTRTYDVLPDRNFTGPTWRAAVDWLPGYKTTLTFETYKEISSIIDIIASHVVIRGVAFGPSWAPTAKLAFSLRAFRNHQSFVDTPGAAVGTAPAHEEIVRGIRLGAFWEVQRRVDVTLAIDHGERESNFIGRNFRYNAFVGNIRYTF